MTDNTRAAGRVILDAFEAHKDRIAIRRSHGFPQMTYGELLENACRLAEYLADNGVKPGKGNRVRHIHGPQSEVCGIFHELPPLRICRCFARSGVSGKQKRIHS